MFFNDSSRAFRVTGVYRAARAAAALDSAGRPYVSLGLRLSGASTFVWAGGSCRADAGSLTCIYENTPFRHICEGEEVIAVHLEPFGAVRSGIEVLDGCEAFREDAERMLDEWSRQAGGCENKCAALLYGLFECLEKTKLREDPRARIIREGARLIGEAFARPDFSVSEAAAACHVSEAYFRRLYRAVYGVSPHEALTQRRMTNAQSLLQDGRCTVAEAALKSGFSDAAYFGTVFRRRTGLTPSAYRAGR